MMLFNYWVALGQIIGLEINTLNLIEEKLGSLQVLFELSTPALKQLGLNAGLCRQIKTIDWSAVERAMAFSEKPHQHIITCRDSRYPALLKEIHTAPVVLYVKGDPLCLHLPQIAMVGSRKPTLIGQENSYRFAKYLTQSGIMITSGMAHGIDAAAHRGALSAGKTIAVLGTGVDQIYPRAHERLAKSIAENGAIVSEFPLGSLPKKAHFPRRNRIISGLCFATLVVEAARRSGSLITARLASEQGRDVFAIPGSIHNPMSRGCHHLIKEGAYLTESVEDIKTHMQSLPGLFKLSPDQEEQKVDKIEQKKDNAFEKNVLSSDCKITLSAIDEAATTVNTLIARTHLNIEKLNSCLTQLELANYITVAPGGYCRKT
jgi:DNA processing protein